MADISILTRLINGIHRDVDLTNNSLVVQSIKIGTTSPAEITKAIAERLIALQNGSDVDETYHTHDGRYFTETELGSVAGTSGAERIGVKSTAVNFTPSSADVEAWLTGIDSALAGAGGTAFSDLDFSLYNDTDNTKILKFDLAGIAVSTTRTILMPDSDVNLGLVATAIQSSEKGAVNGVATLDANQVIPIAQIPAAALERLVIVADETARFALTLATVQNGDTVKQTDTEVMYFVKDDTNLDSALGYSTYSAGTAAAVEWSGVLNTPTTVAGYGITDVDDVAKAAAVADSISDGITDVAPSQNAVFDALATKQAASANLDEASTFFASTDISAAEAEQLTDGSNADSLHSHSSLKETVVAGEAMAATTSFLVRWAVNGESAERVYKASQDATSSDLFYCVGIALSTGAVSAGGNTTITKHGVHTLGASDTPFNASDIGKPVFLTASGAFSVTAPTTANFAVVRVGMVRSTTKIDVNIQAVGVN